MDFSKKKMTLCAIIFIVIGLMLILISFISTGFDFSKINTYNLEKKMYSVTDDFDSIKMQGGSANVYFALSDDNQCYIETMETEKMSYSIEVTDKELTISVDDKGKWYDNITVFSWKEEKMIVYLPKSEYEALAVKCGSGDVRISDNINITEVDIITGSGSVKISDIRKSKNISIDTKSGDVKLSDIENAKNVSIKTNSGEIKAVNCEADDIQMCTKSGDIDGKNIIAGNNIDIQANSGDVDLNNSDAETLNIKTNSGDVSCSLLTDKVFVTKTGSGEVYVPHSTIGGICEIKTGSGDIKVKIKD